MNSEEIETLAGIGFSQLEAEIYLIILQLSKATGYRIAKLLGKPVPNTYKALDNMHKKGAVVSDFSSKKRTYSAVPIGEYLDIMEREFKRKKDAAKSKLKHLTRTAIDEQGIYRLESIEQVFERCINAIKQAEHIVLVDAFPEPLKQIQKVLEEKAAGECQIIVKTYSPVTISGCEIVPTSLKKKSIKTWPGEWLNVVIDGKEHIIAYIETKTRRVFHALWSQNSILSLMLYNGFISELILDGVRQMLRAGLTGVQVSEKMKKYEKLMTHQIPAFQMFLRNHEKPNEEI